MKQESLKFFLIVFVVFLFVMIFAAVILAWIAVSKAEQSESIIPHFSESSINATIPSSNSWDIDNYTVSI